MRVGIFDSGIGGLSVLHRAVQVMPDVDFVYYADEAHVPYGEKEQEEIRKYIAESIAFLLEKQAEVIVIACNTATSAATKEYRSKFPVPIIGMEPAVKQAAEQYSGLPGRILVAATPLTIFGNKLHDLLERVDPEDNVDLVALPNLVRIAEKGDFDEEEILAYMREALQGYRLADYKALVLGCTHFNYFKPYYKKLFPDGIKFVDGTEGTLRQLMRTLKVQAEERAERTGKTEYYFSGRLVTAEEEKKIKRYMLRLDHAESV